MALSYTTVVHQPQTLAMGAVRTKIVDVTLDNSYTTGGYTLDPHQFDMAQIYGAVAVGFGSAQTTAPFVAFNNSTGKLQAFVSNGASPALLNEAPATTDLHTVTVRLLVIGV